jgi:hypothetical protein
MIRNLPHRVNYVEKIDYLQSDASGEGISEMLILDLSYEIEARRSQIYMAQLGM